jgi:radical SAM protein with 4Fe4S-binding SPASM domain
VSIDGIGKSHDRFRGYDGAFDAACKNIQRFQDEGIAVSLSTTVTRKNLNELDKIIDLALDMDCSGFFANAMLPVGRGRKNAERFKLDVQGYRRLYETLVARGVELEDRLAIATDMCFPFLFSPPPEMASSGGSMGCSAGHDTLCVGAEGTVYPCHFLHDFPLGNLMDTDLIALWNKSPVLKNIRNIRKQDMTGACSHCPYAPDPCRGGCRAAAYLVYGDMKAMDPTCFRSPVGDRS